jgi:hypothetical protein
LARGSQQEPKGASSSQSRGLPPSVAHTIPCPISGPFRLVLSSVLFWMVDAFGTGVHCSDRQSTTVLPERQSTGSSKRQSTQAPRNMGITGIARVIRKAFRGHDKRCTGSPDFSLSLYHGSLQLHQTSRRREEQGSHFKGSAQRSEFLQHEACFHSTMSHAPPSITQTSKTTPRVTSIHKESISVACR